ncbi:MAG: dihydropteroate synthase [Turneriella sp.]
MKLPDIWGVVNLTPDSFYAGSRFDTAAAVAKAEEFLGQGAAMVDVGAESTRPGAQTVPAEVQKGRVGAFISAIRQALGDAAVARISVDTRDIAVMRPALDAGIRCINDVSGGSTEIFQLVAEYDAEYVLTHSQGTPQTMQLSPAYADVLAEVKGFLTARTQELRALGVEDPKIIWDPGIGFGKSVEHNLALIANTPRLSRQGVRLLLGVSRKSFIGRILEKDDPADRLTGTLAVQVYLTLRGCDILRLHDVREMADCLKLLTALKKHEL